MKLDLDAKRAARAEIDREPHEVIFGGERFEIPPRMLLETIDLMSEGKIRAGFALLLGDDDTVTRFFAHRPDDLDLEAIMGVYNPGGSPGESGASQVSLPTIGDLSRPTPSPTTASTSRKRATANANSGSGGSSS